MRGAVVALCYVASATAIDDLQRARSKSPRREYKGQFTHDMGSMLNGHLARSHPKTKPCHAWTSEELQEFQATVFTHREDAHDRIYKAAEDSRALRRASLEEHRGHWSDISRAATDGNALVTQMQRDGHCHEAVMWWVHHLSHETRQSLRNLTVPGVPLQEWREPIKEEGKAARRVYHEHYHPSSTCQACHLGGMMWMDSEAAADGNTRDPAPYPRQVNGNDRARRCDEYYGEHEGGACLPCDGISGAIYGDMPDEGIYPACENVARPHDVPHHERVTSQWPHKCATEMRGSDRWPRETPSGNASCGYSTDCSRPAAPWPSEEQGDHLAGRPGHEYHWYSTVHSILYYDKREGHVDSGGILRHETAYEFPPGREGAERSLTGQYGEINEHKSQIHMQTRQQAHEPCPEGFTYGPCTTGNPGAMISMQHKWIDELNKSGVDDSIHVDWRRPKTTMRDGCTCLADPVGLPDFVHAFDNATYLGRARFVPPWQKTFGPNAGGPPDGVPVVTDVWVKWSFHLYMDIQTSYAAMFSSPFGGVATYGNWTHDPDAMWPEWRETPESNPIMETLCINPTSYNGCPKAFPWSPSSLKTPIPAHHPHHHH